VAVRVEAGGDAAGGGIAERMLRRGAEEFAAGDFVKKADDAAV
jgi:hypothetical protein